MQIFKQLQLEKSRQNAAIILQSQFRKILAIKQLEILKFEKARLNAVVVLQSHFRRWQAEKILAQLQQEKARLHAVIILQAHVRRWQAEKILAALKRQKLENSAACKITETLRLWILKKQALKIVTDLRQKQAENQAAIKIQSYFRRYQAMKLLAELQHEKDQIYAAILIQSYFRGYLARQEYLVLRAEKARLQAAIMLQKHVRAWSSRKLFSVLRENFAEKTTAATKIQTCFRGFLARKKLEKLRTERQILRENSATKIQATVRMFIQRQKFLREKEDKVFAVTIIQRNFRKFSAVRKYQNLLKLREICALKIQCWYRKVRAMQLLQLLKNLQAEEEAILLEQQTEAAVIIQANFKGYLARKKISAEKLAKRKYLAKKFDEQESLGYNTKVSLKWIKEFKTTAKMSQGINLLVRTIKLLPSIQPTLILNEGGMQYLSDFVINSCTQTPPHLEILAETYNLLWWLAPYLKSEPDRREFTAVVRDTGKFFINYKFSFKHNVNTMCLHNTLRFGGRFFVKSFEMSFGILNSIFKFLILCVKSIALGQRYAAWKKPGQRKRSKATQEAQGYIPEYLVRPPLTGVLFFDQCFERSGQSLES